MDPKNKPKKYRLLLDGTVLEKDTYKYVCLLPKIDFEIAFELKGFARDKFIQKYIDQI